jgi:hypothetical protein
LSKAGLGRWVVDADTGGRPATVFVLSGNSGNGNTTPLNPEENGHPLPLPRVTGVGRVHLVAINELLAEAAEDDADPIF